MSWRKRRCLSTGAMSVTSDGGQKRIGRRERTAPGAQAMVQQADVSLLLNWC